MGGWTTLHLFDEKQFKETTIPLLRGKSGDLLLYYLDFMKYVIIGVFFCFSDKEILKMAQKGVEEIIEQANLLNDDFTNHSMIENFHDYDELYDYVSKTDSHYHFARFFESIVFQTSADFFPHLACGKYGLRNRFDFKWNSIANELLGRLDQGTFTFFSNDGMGLTSWIGREETEVLFLDCHELENSDSRFDTGFFKMIKMAAENQLGLIMGANLRITEHELKHSQFKLISETKWKEMAIDELIFRYE